MYFMCRGGAGVRKLRDCMFMWKIIKAQSNRMSSDVFWRTKMDFSTDEGCQLELRSYLLNVSMFCPLQEQSCNYTCIWKSEKALISGLIYYLSTSLIFTLNTVIQSVLYHRCHQMESAWSGVDFIHLWSKLWLEHVDSALLHDYETNKWGKTEGRNTQKLAAAEGRCTESLIKHLRGVTQNLLMFMDSRLYFSLSKYILGTLFKICQHLLPSRKRFPSDTAVEKQLLHLRRNSFSISINSSPEGEPADQL